MRAGRCSAWLRPEHVPFLWNRGMLQPGGAWPWYLIPANNKPDARLAAFRILIDRLGKGVSLEPRPLDPKAAEVAAQLFDLSQRYCFAACQPLPEPLRSCVTLRE
jgi:hypothetical protein